MKLSPVLIACSLMTTSLAAAHASGASVNVVYSNPDKFTDAGPYRGAGKERDRTLKNLADYLQTLGGKFLTPDETLKIEVLDLDLAGRIEPWHAENTDIRVMRGVDWPGMTVRYTLTRNEALVSQGEERIADLNYLMTSSIGVNSADPLRFEKHMLKDWFRKRFGQR